MANWNEPEPILVGDPVETCEGTGVVKAIELVERVYRKKSGRFVHSKPRYIVALDEGGEYATQSLSYLPTPELIAERVRAVRGPLALRTEVSSDFVGFDGPGIRETTFVFGPKVVA